MPSACVLQVPRQTLASSTILRHGICLVATSTEGLPLQRQRRVQTAACHCILSNTTNSWLSACGFTTRQCSSTVQQRGVSSSATCSAAVDRQPLWFRGRKRKHLDPTQIAAAIASEDIAAAQGGPASYSPQLQRVPARTAGAADDESPFLELPDPFSPSSAQEDAAGKAKRRRLGVLQSVPVVSPSNEHLASALKRAGKVTYAPHIKNEAEKERNRAARQMDTLMKELSVPLSKYVNGFPDPSKLHPFDASLLQLTVSTVAYRSVLSKVDALRKSLQETGKAYANRAANAPNKQTAVAVALEGCEAMERVYRNGARNIDDLKEMAKKLRALPVLEVGLPTLALVGAPNVGKSSLVQVLSSGTPEVCNYPFTTRSIKMGHFYLDGRKHQVTDTPGLLSREDEHRNEMELLTLAALECLPTSVLFVMDLTEECGTSVADQWDIRCEVRARFPDKDWIDVFSKADLLGDVYKEADQQAACSNSQLTPAPAPADLKHIEEAVQASTQDNTARHTRSFQEELPGQVQQPVDLAVRLPNALWVSSTTKQGITRLQASIVRMFWQQHAAAVDIGTPDLDKVAA